MKVLVARTDKLGDVVLSLPALAWLAAARPRWELHALVAPAAAPLVERAPGAAAVRLWPDDAPRLAAERYDAAVLLCFDAGLAAHLRAIGVRPRVGPLSKPASWRLLDRGVWQRRSRSRRHERDLNVDLVARLAGERPDAAALPMPRLGLSPAQAEAGRRFRRDEAGGAPFVAFVHPGSAGSALAWPPARFGAVARRLAAREGWRVFLTGGPDDAAAVAAAAAAAGPDVVSLAGRHDLSGFLGLLAGGDLLVGPSTGPLHMAAALGLAAVGVYPPVPVQSPARWGPLGPHAVALAPDVACPGRLDCRGEGCRLWNCLDRIGEQAVAAAAAEATGARAAGRGART